MKMVRNHDISIKLSKDELVKLNHSCEEFEMNHSDLLRLYILFSESINNYIKTILNQEKHGNTKRFN